MIGVIRGTAPWSMASTVVSIVVAVLLLGGAVGLWWRKLANSTPSTRVDKAGSMMGSGADIAFMREKAALADARRLGVDSPGLPIAKTLSGQMLYSGWEPITRVYRWLTRETDDEAVGILKDAGYPQIAQNVDGIISAPDKQRGGVFGVARQMANCLTSAAVLKWVTPPEEGEVREEFNARDFVRGRNTLFLLSKEGAGTAGPLVTALTVAVVEAAEELAVALGGRLRLPMVAMLDEAANVCRWKELPNLYSHYGSRGIVICTILQSWSQGVVVWGREGMRKLWSAANIKVYGGGVSETEFLGELSQLIGDYVYSNVSVSSSRQSGSSRSVDNDRKDKILDVSDLAALPRGRAVVFASGAPATMVQTIPWYTGPDAAAVKASLAKYDPAQQLANGGA